MRIYRMQATFGKLQNAVLTLEPGLNIIEAPNEWGKSTWCAFLAAMLYGLDTRAKTTKGALADKERYAPWSGQPMSGRIDLNWNGKDITIERSTRRRTPMGEFRAYETASGLAVPELTADNCGQMLLGVEQSVFRRAGFIRFADLPVTQDDSLRRRLNALVTTGDESGDGEALARELRELKNRCRYNRTGLLPQAQEQRAQLEQTLRELDSLEKLSQELQVRRARLEEECAALENHLDALAYSAFLENQQRLDQAGAEALALESQLAQLEKEIAGLPSREQAEEKLRQLKQLRRQWEDVRAEMGMLPQEPVPPAVPQQFQGVDARQLDEDTLLWHKLGKSRGLVWFLLMGAGVLAAIGFYFVNWLLPAVLGLGLAVFCALLAVIDKGRRRRSRQALEDKYGSKTPEEWAAAWKAAQARSHRYHAARKEYLRLQGDLEERLRVLQARQDTLCGDQPLEKTQELWEQVVRRWEDYHTLCRETQRSRDHYETLRAAVKTVRPPAQESNLSLDAAQTEGLLRNARQELRHLEGRLWHYRGTMESLGQRTQLEEARNKVNQRILALEDTYAALTIAQQTLEMARLELQRRFAPRITRRAQEILGQLTDGRYQRLRLEEDFTLQARADQEDVLRGVLWRSDGTADQLYLALRLAVAEELTPGTPLILDDALVRFDDTRLKAALQTLQRQSDNRQVILFTCQRREKEML